MNEPSIPVTMTHNQPRTPKLSPSRKRDGDAGYRYYAGYSADFVHDVVLQLGLGGAQLLVDPWNGAGTTTAVAQQLGIQSWGGDINPVMSVIAKARLLGTRARPSELSLCESILTNAAEVEIVSEPLRAWFGPEASISIRSLERSIAQLLDPNNETCDPVVRASGLSPSAAFFYVVLFRTVRDLLQPFQSSNPTWLRRPDDERSKLRPSRLSIQKVFREHLRQLTANGNLPVGDSVAEQRDSRPGSVEPSAGLPDVPATITVASSTQLPLPDRSASAVVASPPYCTRIDYAVATAPELAILGVTDADSRALRETMIGSSTVRGDIPDVDFTWGPTCAHFLTQVARHPSKASASYYLKSHLQYFGRLALSLREIDRVLSPNAPCVLVVQDSHYKEVHNDLPTIVAEMGEANGWCILNRFDYSCPRHMARLHPGARTYRKAPWATESVLLFQTTSR